MKYEEWLEWREEYFKKNPHVNGKKQKIIEEI
jgi:hypothetical protein